MTYRPIPFSAQMVRALLDGSKTQTRRMVKYSITGPNPPASTFDWHHPKTNTWVGAHGGQFEFRNTNAALLCPYGQPGDRLWVREAHHRTTDGGPVLLGYQEPGENREFEQFGVHVREFRHHLGGWGGRASKNFPSIHMPRWASRITLEITGVRVERLQACNEFDARQEGSFSWAGEQETPVRDLPEARLVYRQLWESINGPGSWAANPWVWVIEFKMVTS